MLDSMRSIGENGHIEDHNLLHAFYNLWDHTAQPEPGQVLVWTGTVWVPGEPVQVMIMSVLPAADAALRGRIVVLEAADLPDASFICKRLGDGSYAWVEFA